MGRRQGERRDERGAVALVVAALAMVLVLIAAFVVDIGMQRVARRDMQSLATLTALDLSRELDGRDRATLVPVMETQKAASVARNGTTLGDAPTLTVQLGYLDPTGEFVEMTAADDVPTAVRVEAATKVDFAFGIATSGGVTRTAVAAQDSGACFKLGSYAASVRSGDSALLGPLLGDALGGSLDLQALGYEGLADASVSLLDLLQAPGITVLGTDSAAQIEPVTLSQLALATATVLEQQGDTANATILQTIAAQVGGGQLVDLADLVSVASGDQAGLDTQLNVLDLITGAAFLANGSGLAVQDLGLTIPLVGSVSGSLSVIQAPQTACGRVGTTARTAQATLGPLTATLSQSQLNGIVIAVPGLTNIGITSPRPTSVSVSLAGATGTLTDIVCSPDTSLTVRVASSLTSLSLESHVTVAARVSVLGLGVVNLSLPYTITSTASASATAGSDHVVPLPPYDTAVPTGTGTLGLDNVTLTATLDNSWTATVLGLNVRNSPLLSGIISGTLPLVLGAVTSGVAQPLAHGLDQVLVGPLQDLLGLTVASADLFGVEPAPRCDLPALRG